MSDQDPTSPRIDWEAFYGNFRKPGYIAGFEIRQKLGAGVFGIVYKARKESIGKDYAIKFLKVDDEATRDAILRELDCVRHFAQIDHPHLVSIEDRGEVDGIPYIVMAYAGERTLADLLSETRAADRALPEDQVWPLFLQVARGVQALHEHGIVHFDLKPANVFLKGDVARVGDYGLAKLVNGSRNSLSFGRGTPNYMAPEILRHKGDHRSDVYALGVLLYEMIVGRPPFQGDSEWEVLQQHEKAEPELPPSLKSVARAIVARCLRKNPDARYQSVAELIDEVAEAARIDPMTATLPAPAAVAPPPAPAPAPIDIPSPRRAGRERHRPRRPEIAAAFGAGIPTPPGQGYRRRLARRRGPGVFGVLAMGLVFFAVFGSFFLVRTASNVGPRPAFAAVEAPSMPFPPAPVLDVEGLSPRERAKRLAALQKELAQFERRQGDRQFDDLIGASVEALPVVVHDLVRAGKLDSEARQHTSEVVRILEQIRSGIPVGDEVANDVEAFVRELLAHHGKDTRRDWRDELDTIFASDPWRRVRVRDAGQGVRVETRSYR